MRTRTQISLVLRGCSAVALAALAACALMHGEGAASKGAKASALIEARSKSSVSGQATFTEVPGGLLIDVSVAGATPGLHALHVHETGDCSDPEAKSAGGHWNPDASDHGAPDAVKHHAGDLGNMVVDEGGNGRKVLLVHGLTVQPGTHSVVGRALVVHAQADDLVTQPTGAAGGRIGCGVID
jgi:Cu-Zn family superoxide dismutase